MFLQEKCLLFVHEYVSMIGLQEIAIFVIINVIFADVFRHTCDVPVRMGHSSCFEECRKGDHCLLLRAGVLNGWINRRGN